MISTSKSFASRKIIINRDVQKDATMAVFQQLKSLGDKGATSIVFEKGVYHFYPDLAHEEFCHISNHNDVLAPIGFVLKNKENLTIDGQGSTFIFHGRMIPFLMNDCNNIIVQNLNVDYSEPFFSQGTVVAHGDESYDISFTDDYPYEIQNGKIIFLKPYYLHDIGQNMAFDPVRKAPAFQTEKYNINERVKVKTRFMPEPFVYPYKVDEKDEYIKYMGMEQLVMAEELEPGLVRLSGIKKDLPPLGLIVTFKGMQGANRIAPGFKVNNSKNIKVHNVAVHHAGGMGFLFENSEDVTLEKCVVSPTGDRIISTTADASHFVGCRGNITLRDCSFSNQLDDAMNVHGTYQEIFQIIDKKTLLMRVGHFQQLGFRLAQPGDSLGIVRIEDSFFPYREVTVNSIEEINGRYNIIHLNEEVSSDVQVGDLLENLSAYPEVLVENCRFFSNRARGLLISTPKKTIIRNNFFSTEMEAILMPVEDSNWFESGSAANVVIENNTFQDCVTGGMDRGVICFRTDGDNKNIAFKNIEIVNNVFNHFDNLILEATNVDGLDFSDNIITNSASFPQQFPDNPVITIKHSLNVIIGENKYRGTAKEFLID